MFSTNEIMSAVGGGSPVPQRQSPVGFGGQPQSDGGPVPQNIGGMGPNFDEIITRIQGEMQSIAGRLQQDQMLVQMGDRAAAGRIGQMQMQIQTLQQRLAEAQQGKSERLMQSQAQMEQEKQMKQDYMNKVPMAGSAGGASGGPGGRMDFGWAWKGDK